MNESEHRDLCRLLNLYAESLLGKSRSRERRVEPADIEALLDAFEVIEADRYQIASR